jgi:ABC-type oligopeptide transport system substrate-binding subunit/class 3 adenylate cyclase
MQCGAPLQSGTQATSEDRITALRRGAPQELQERLQATSAQMEGERKLVTILFADIVGSTAISTRLDPEEWKEVVNGAHQRISQAVYRYEGTIAQLLGDGVLAFFGAPIIHEDDPQRAVRAALAIQASIREYREELSGYLDDFQVRVGLNTGTVVVGAVGGDLHMEYLAIGDSVNLAARLQSAAKPGEVLLSEATARLLGEGFTLEDRGEFQLKGFPNPVMAYTVLSAKSSLHPRPALPGLRSPMVGREAEMGVLQGALSQLAQGSGGIVAVLGEAGIGKSRLIEEAITEAPPGVRFLEGRALSYGAALPFWTIQQLINADLGLSEADPEPKVRVALRRRTQALFGERAASLSPYLAHLLGLKLDEDQAARLSGLDGETVRHQTLVSLGEYFAALAEAQPTVLLFEDLHWDDPSSLQALEGLLPLTDRSALLILLASRLDRDHPSWKLKLKAETDYPHRYTEISLRRLSSQDSDQLVDNLLELSQVPPELQRLLLSRSEGNPFYLEEVVRGLIETGALVRQGGGWRLQGQIDELAIPGTLQGVLLARIDRLQEDVRRTLQIASVIGKSFLYRLLEAIDQAEQALDQHLSELQRLDLVREKTRQPELEYIFKHSLTQEAAYSSLLMERRKEFHRRVGEALEALFADREEEYLGLLAHHFDRAGEGQKAAAYRLRAGDKARFGEAPLEAVQHYRRAIHWLEGMGEDQRVWETWLKLGMVYHSQFDFKMARQAFEQAFALQKMRQPGGEQRITPAGGPTLRVGFPGLWINSLDPGKMIWTMEGNVAGTIYSGIARLDEEHSLVPHGAISWEVLEGGVRYRIHLRDDVRWSDGAPVTAADYEWAWKRNMGLPGDEYPQLLLDGVVGARDYRLGHRSNPDHIGVRALGDFTLEVRLEAPLAYFPYLLALPITFPLPRAVIERFGKEWWRPEHVVSNGPFLLKEFSPGLVAVERNPDYFGDFEGNVGRAEWLEIKGEKERLRRFSKGELDLATMESKDSASGYHPIVERYLRTSYIALGFDPPLDDVRVRRALLQALDKNALASLFDGIPAEGGIIPPGMPGHSPGINLPYDLPLARRLLAEAGYPDGKGFPILSAYIVKPTQEEITRQWREGLGVEVQLESDRDHEEVEILAWAWTPDYPDPDSFLRHATFLTFLRKRGWNDPQYEALLERAVRTSNRAERMALYREADQRLVDQVLVFPVVYNWSLLTLRQSWVSGFKDEFYFWDYTKVRIMADKKSEG